MSKFTLFFCPSKDMERYSKELPNPKMGCSTAGIINLGFSEEIATQEFSLEDFNIETIKIENPEKPALKYDEIIDAVNRVSRNKKNLVCFVLNNGLSGKEERMQTFLQKTLPKNSIIVGGSSADDFNFKNTYCCINDEYYSGSGIMLIGTNFNVYAHKENIYEITDKCTIVTKAKGRTIYELDGIPAADRLKELLNIPIEGIEKNAPRYPLGVNHNGDITMCSIAGVNPDKSINLYRMAIPSMILWILKPSDYIEKAKNTSNEILKRGTPLCTLAISCIFRRLLFEQDNVSKSLEKYIREIKAVGLTGYGEQIGIKHANQTMVTVTFYK